MAYITFATKLEDGKIQVSCGDENDYRLALDVASSQGYEILKAFVGPFGRAWQQLVKWRAEYERQGVLV